MCVCVCACAHALSQNVFLTIYYSHRILETEWNYIKAISDLYLKEVQIYLNPILFLNFAENNKIVKDIIDVFTNSSKPSTPFNSKYSKIMKIKNKLLRSFYGILLFLKYSLYCLVLLIKFSLLY